MHLAARLGVHASALAVVFAAAWGVGAWGVGAWGVGAWGVGAWGVGAWGVGAWGVGAWGVIATTPVPGTSAVDAVGLVDSAGGWTLEPAVDTLMPGVPGEYAFTITGPDGRAVTAFDELRLDVVRRDAAGFQRLAPVPGADGVWRAPLTLPAGGAYRVYADLVPTGGPAVVLGTDLFAPGGFTPIPLPPSRVSQADGYRVRLDGTLVAGRAAPVFATVTRDGVPVTDLEPVGNGFGRLVALRRSDLAHLDVPPAAAAAAGDRAGPGIAFTAQVPAPGGHRLFLDFRHGGVVRTVEFTVDAVGAP